MKEFRQTKAYQRVIALCLALVMMMSMSTGSAMYAIEVPVDEHSLDVSATINVTLNYMDGSTPEDAFTYKGSLPTLTRVGYTFDGWYEGVYSEEEWTYGNKVEGRPERDATLLAKWIPHNDIQYKTYYMLEDLNADTYTTVFTQTDNNGTSGETVTPAVKDYPGFTAPESQTVVVAPDGTTEVFYKYTRNSYQYTLGSSDGVDTSGSTESGIYEYEAPITLKAKVNDGYTWAAWKSSDASLVGNKTEMESTFTMPVGAITMTPSTTENTYTITYNANGGTDVSSQEYKVSDDLTLAAESTRTGYTFAGWNLATATGGWSAKTYSASETVGTGKHGDITLVAQWTANTDTKYVVKHYLEDLSADTYTLKDTVNGTGTTAAEVSPDLKSYEGFTAPAKQTVTIAADGSTVVEYKYTRNSYKFTLGTHTGVTTTGSTATGTYEYGATITLKAAANNGYTWSKWTSNNTTLQGNLTTANTTFTMPAGAITMTPGATENSYTITYDENGGSAVTDLSYKVTTDVTLAAAPSKTGYTFAGWKLATAAGGWSAKTYTASEAIGTGKYGSITLVAQWTANTNTKYVVKHLIEDLGADTYSTYTTENLTGTTDASTAPAVKSITGFTAPSTKTVTIAADGSTVVEYKYTRNSYKFTLGTHTGVTTTGSTATGTYEYGATITLKAAAKNGYTWSKWTSSNTTLQGNLTTANTTFTMPAGAITMTPGATENSYTITYDENGGSAVTDLNYKVTTNVTLAAAPSKTGYTFAGWKLATAVGGWSAKTYSASEAIGTGKYGNITLVAQWTANTNTAYKVNHYIEDLNASTYTKYGSTESKTGTTAASVTLANLKKTITGFTYKEGKVGSTAATTTTILADGSRVIDLYYTRNSYAVTINKGTGISSVTGAGTYEYGATVNVNASLSSGYSWNGWTASGITAPDTQADSFTMPAGAVTLTANGKLVTYTITYNLNGGALPSGKTNPASYNVTTAAFTLNNPTKTGYTFAGWTGSNGTTKQTTVSVAQGSTGNKSYTANWTANTNTAYKVNHYIEDLNASTYSLHSTDSKTGTTAASVTLANLKKTITGFTYKEGKVGGTVATTTTILADGSSVIDLYYTRNSYAVTINKGTGISSVTGAGTYEYGATVNINASLSSGYAWNGWTASGITAPDTQADSFTMPAGAVTLTANGKLVTYTITYNLNGGALPSGKTNPASYNVTTAAFTLNNPTKTGYTFAGWTGSNGTTKQTTVSVAQGSTGNKSYTANWTANTNTAYKVNHYIEDLNTSTYSLHSTDSKTGTTAASVTIANLKKTITGFTYSQGKVGGTVATTTTILADGSRVIDLYYTRNSYKFTLGSHTGVNTSGSSATGTYEYGATITLKAAANNGYTWSKWTSNNTTLQGNLTTANTTFKMPAGAITMTPGATAISYTITYNLDGGSLATGKTNPSSYTIVSDEIVLNNPTKEGYTFLGWTGSNGSTPQTTVSIPTGSTEAKTYVANWKTNFDITLTVPDKTYSKTFTVTGTVSDPSAMVTVNNTAATVASNGTWSANVTLDSSTEAGRTITAVATRGSQVVSDNIIYEERTLDYSTIRDIGYYSGTTDLDIPTTYKKNDSYYFVTAIGNSACNYNYNLKTVTIPESVTSIGNYAFNGCSGLTSITIPESVTSIGEEAFAKCSKLTSINIPSSVESISNGLFNGCKLLANITIPNSVTSIKRTAFQGCTGLTSITIPNSVTSIGSSAFSNCTSLTTITIPESVTSIGSKAFYGCVGLTNITIPNSVTLISSDLFNGCTNLVSVTLPNSATQIDYQAFSGCTNLANITIPNTVTSIGSSAFRDCTSLTTITIPESVTSIGSSAFYGCSGLTSITIPSSITSFGSDWLYGSDPQFPKTWYNAKTGEAFTVAQIPTGTAATYVSVKPLLMTLNVPDKTYSKTFTVTGTVSDPSATVTVNNVAATVASNGTWSADVTLDPSTDEGRTITAVATKDSNVASDSITFETCPLNNSEVGINSSNTTINIPVTYIYNDKYYIVTSIGAYTFHTYRNLETVTIPDSVTSIGNNAFYGCSSLTSISIPNSVTSLGTHIFYKCTKLESVSIPNSISSIGRYTFYGCTGLTSITIPNSVTSIESAAFYGCSSLTSISIPNSVTSLGNLMFVDCTSLVSVTISNSITTIKNSTFEGCINLNNVIIPNSVTSIEDRAFYGCTGLTSITIPNSVTSIGKSAFDYAGLTSVVIPNSVTSIKARTFFKCPLTNITIPNSVTSIEDSAFMYCDALEFVYYSGSETEWANITIGTYNTSLTDATITYNYNPARAASLSFTPRSNIAEWENAGESKVLISMPDVLSLNKEAEINAPDGTTLYAWLVNSGMAQEVVLLEDLEAILHSVYDEVPDWEMTVIPLYRPMNDGEKLLAYAAEELGTRESTTDYILDSDGNHKGYTKYGKYYGIPYGDWCAMFIGYGMDQTGLEDMPFSPSCSMWVSLAKEQDLFKPASEYVPAPGDVVFMDRDRNGSSDHVGILVELDLEKGEYTTIEGNYSDGVYKVTRTFDARTIGYMPISECGIEQTVEVPTAIASSVISSTAPYVPPVTEAAAPSTEATESSVTESSTEATELPTTEPHATEPPATEPPATEPPTTEPPATEPPATEPPTTEPPATEPPATEPPTTEPPTTEPSEEPTGESKPAVPASTEPPTDPADPSGSAESESVDAPTKSTKPTESEAAALVKAESVPAVTTVVTPATTKPAETAPAMEAAKKENPVDGNIPTE